MKFEKLLITPEEAIELSYNHATTKELAVVRDIVEEWGKKYGNNYSHRLFDFYRMLSAVFTAGRIQGKREERAARHKEKPATN